MQIMELGGYVSGTQMWKILWSTKPSSEVSRLKFFHHRFRYIPTSKPSVDELKWHPTPTSKPSVDELKWRRCAAPYSSDCTFAPPPSYLLYTYLEAVRGRAEVVAMCSAVL